METVPKSRLSANDKGDNEMKQGSVYISPSIYFMAQVNPRKPQLEDCLIKAV